MEGNLYQGSMVPVVASFSGFDLSGSMRVHQQAEHPHNIHQPQTHLRQGSSVHSVCHDGFPLAMGTLQNCDQPISMADSTKGDKSKNSASEDDEPSLTEDGADVRNEAVRGKKGSPWQRVKWTDEMVKLLITALSYISEDSISDSGNGGTRKFAVLQKKGKWKSISKVMAERCYRVSPQQCEDKFNDLNKRYKRLNDMIGRGTCCQVVENPGLLDVLDYLSEKDKEDIRKILGSKHLFYEEMCSYHNGNRLHLPHDPVLQRSLQAALRNRDDHDNDDVKRSHYDDHEEDDQDVDTDDHDEFEETYASHQDNRGVYGALGGSAKKLTHGLVQEDTKMSGNSLNCQDCNKNSNSLKAIDGPIFQYDVKQGLPEGNRAAWLQKQWIESRNLELEEQRLQIQVEMLELEKQRLKWQRFSKKKDRELEKLRMENEKMKLENERIALKLKRREMGAGFN